MSPSKILFYFCVSFVAGIFLESVIKIPQNFVWGFLFLATVLIFSSLLIKKINFIFGFCLLFLVLGIVRVQISEFNIASDKLSKSIGRGCVTFTGTINDEPDVRDASQKIKVGVGNSVVLVTTNKYPEYNYLDTVKITGKLEQPTNTDTFNYKNYLLKDHIYSVIGFPKIEIISTKHQYGAWSYFYDKVLFLKHKLENSLQTSFLPPHSLILEGIIFGNNKNMTQDLRNQLNSAGLRFLTAISGVHVVILSAILISLLLFLGMKRTRAAGLSVILIWLYVVLTGFTASGIRAAIMGSIFIFAEILGRQNTSSRTIALAASLMLLQNPLLLIYDIGFQLSFVACLGIIYLKPIFSVLLKFLFKENLRELSDILAITFSAQISTMPLMLFNFGSVSLVSFITSLLIIPVVPWILSFGFLFCIFASISPILGWFFYIPCWFLISYFIKIMEIFSQPWAVRCVQNVHWAWLLVFYVFIGFSIRIINKKYMKRFI